MKLAFAGILLLALVGIVGVALAGTARAQAGSSFSTITGFVFHDLDGDGVREEGEPGLQGRRAELLEGSTALRYVFTDQSGRFEVDTRLEGDYVVRVDPDGRAPAASAPTSLPRSTRCRRVTAWTTVYRGT